MREADTVCREQRPDSSIGHRTRAADRRSRARSNAPMAASAVDHVVESPGIHGGGDSSPGSVVGSYGGRTRTRFER